MNFNFILLIKHCFTPYSSIRRKNKTNIFENMTRITGDDE